MQQHEIPLWRGRALTGSSQPLWVCWLQKVVQAASAEPEAHVFWNLQADWSLSCSWKVAQAIWDIQSCSSRMKFRLTGYDNSDISKEKYKLRFKRITPVLWGFPSGSDSKEFACNAGDLGSIPELERSPGEGNGNTSSSILAWKIPWAEEPSRLQSMGSQRVRIAWATNTLLSYWVVEECKPRK